MVNRERNTRLLETLKLPENSVCADCGLPEPDWASCKVGVFICLQCSGVHRNFTESGKVKSIRLDNWEDERLVQFMIGNGNLKAKKKYEAFVPPFYYRPHARDCDVLKEQWIRAKYQREEFMSNKATIHTTAHREGFLYKRGRDSKGFQERKFVLSRSEGVLKYYTKDNGKGPKGIIPIQSLNVTFQGEKIRHQHGLEITYMKDSQTRNIFVYHDSGEEIVAWYNALRAARFHYLKTTYPQASEAELIPKITRNYSKVGYMEKTGPKQKEAFKKRWFNLDSGGRKLLYYKNPLDAFETGGIFIGSKERGYTVKEGLPQGMKGNNWDCGIIIGTPAREFVLTCENVKEQREWLDVLRDVLSQPMTKEDIMEEANFRRKHPK
ncbi:arf-GAP with dual PH domain-containing protein 2 isoform X1 [Xenopus laevis]|uniref:Arf-GAP with dual PH domain-containing protein 2 isoform X1 n=2 Tax=Xenopus laevis TaxID=8355 RepID=A0A8J0TVJ0_XENLA|nr:arf-GAP with dual PH domain-containing protein 2 isoform X1 [Xenopus laevis]